MVHFPSWRFRSLLSVLPLAAMGLLSAVGHISVYAVNPRLISRPTANIKSTAQSANKSASSTRPDPKPTLILRQFSTDKPIRMIAYGDMRFTDPATVKGTNPKVRQWLAEKIGVEKPEALLLIGDMPFVGEKTTDWAEYQKETASWKAAGFPVLPCTGNHEIYYNKDQGIKNYLDNFPLIERHLYYSAVLGSVEVISLDMTQSVGPHSDQGRWFAAQLDHLPATIDFLLILYHTPWVADAQSQMVAGLPTKDGLILRTMLETRLPRMRAKVVVIHGHIHNYERFERYGVEYVVSGGGGAVPYPILFRGSNDLYRDKGFPVYNYLTLEVGNHELHAVMYKVIDPESATLAVEAKDSFVIKANPAIKAIPKPKSFAKPKPSLSLR